MILPVLNRPDPGPVEPGREGPAQVALVSLCAAGRDPRRDGVYRIQARWRGSLGIEEREWATRPEGLVGCAAARARLERASGASAEALEDAAEGGDVLGELSLELAGRLWLVPHGAAFRAQFAALAPTLTAPRSLGLDELWALLATGLGGAGEGEGPPDLLAMDPAALADALSRVVASLRSMGRPGAAALALGWRQAAAEWTASGPALAQRLEAALGILDRPGLWAGLGAEVWDLPGDGWLSLVAREYGTFEAALDAVLPRWAEGARERTEGPSLAPHGPWVRPLDEPDRERVEAIFTQWAPSRAGLAERPAQTAVARAVAKSLGTGELLLLHAPTGTGKTLAYLVPCLLFAVRNRVRVGVATYTRTLQNQAMARDVPLALELLSAQGALKAPPGGQVGAEPGGAEDVRVAVLKGRGAYLCWRAFLAALAHPGEGGPRWTASLALLAFALGSSTGDLDELARPVFGGEQRNVEAELDRLLGDVHGDSGCCSASGDRATCAAEVARKTAERAHLVLTNHALVMARPELLTHLVFDECEHLHDQAHAAYSHRFSLAAARQELGRLLGTGSGRAPMERLLALLPTDAPARALARDVVVQAGEALGGLDPLEAALSRFVRWRRGKAEEVGERDGHSLCLEYLRSGEGADLVRAHGQTARALRAAVVGLAQLPAELAGEPEARRSLRRLERGRAELEELASALSAWLPTLDGALAHRREMFYDVEELTRGYALSARVLLPPEVLGRYFYPELSGAVLISATTVLRGGFDAARAYLGLDRAAEPAPEEQREGRRVLTARAPESFDYRRVLVAVPSDLVPYRQDKQRWLVETADFVLRLSERSRGRTLVLFTAAEDAAQVARHLEAPLAALGVDLLWQGMEGQSKERLAERFRAGGECVLLGLDTFWFGADFPGEALEYLVIAKLPYGVPDRYHFAQCAALGSAEQRRRIYLPRALARFRQGFGRLMRRGSDRGCVFVLDSRARESRHKLFLAELPIGPDGARLVLGTRAECLGAAFEHMGIEGP